MAVWAERHSILDCIFTVCGKWNSVMHLKVRRPVSCPEKRGRLIALLANALRSLENLNYYVCTPNECTCMNIDATR